MMARFCAYVEKVFSLGSRMAALCDRRRRPSIPTTGVFASAFVMFATGRRRCTAWSRTCASRRDCGGW